MASRLSLAILVACLVAAPGVAVAQAPAGDLTFQMPLNLTKLSADLAKIRVSCKVTSTALRAERNGTVATDMAAFIEIPVSNGQVVTTANVVLSNYSLVNPAGVTATYQCSVAGFDRTGSGQNFSQSSTNPTYRLTPSLGPLNGTFTW